jgi:PAS domain S-box-containing protein
MPLLRKLRGLWTRRKNRRLVAYLMAVTICLMAYANQSVFSTNNVTAIVLFLAVALPAWYGGFRPGVLALICVLVVAFAITGFPPSETDGVAIVFFMVIELLIFWGFVSIGQAARDNLARAIQSERLIDLASDAFVVRDLNVRGAVHFWNGGAERLYGYSAEEAIGHSAHDLLHTQYPDDEDAIINTAARLGKWEGELIQQRKDGEFITVHSRWSVDDHSALEVNRPRALEVNRDITIQKALEREHRLRVTAEAAVKARDEFLAIAAHELKTPVTSLSGFAQILELELSGRRDQERIERAAKIIGDQTARLNHLIGQLLDVSRLSAGRLVLTLSRAELNRLVVELADRRRSNLQDPTLIRLYMPEESLYADLDVARFEQVLGNVLDNALKFAPSLPVEITLSRADSRTVEVSIRDHGPGVAPDLYERIFDRSFSASPSDSTAGMGLGLYISKQILEAHGGTISIVSPNDGGACFVIHLPLSDAA